MNPIPDAIKYIEDMKLNLTSEVDSLSAEINEFLELKKEVQGLTDLRNDLKETRDNINDTRT